MLRLDVNQFWRNVGKLVTDEGMSWTGLAQIAGLSPQSLSSAKHAGSELRIGTLLRICSVLETTPVELLEGRCAHAPVCRQEVSSELLNMAWSVSADAAVMMLVSCLDEQEQLLILESAQRMKENNV